MNMFMRNLKRRFAPFIRLPWYKKALVIGGSAAIVLIVGGVITTIYFANTLGSEARIMNRNNTGVTLLDRNGQKYYQFYDAHSQTQVPLQSIAPVARQAVIASEDKDFYRHAGFSIPGFLNALRQNLVPGGTGGGGSTITQQLVKNALLTEQRSYVRKYQELVLSIEIERRYSKDEILEMYLNSVYFGEGAFGIEDASQTYFGKPAKDLDLAQASMLAGLLPAPSAYSPISGDVEKAEGRQTYVLGRMQKDGYVTAEQQTVADAEPLAYQPPKAEDITAPHFALMVRAQLEQEYGEEKIARSGFTVTTSIALDMQNKAEDAVEAQVARLAGSNVSNGAAVVIDPKSGQILAMVGSADWNNDSFGKLNMATAGRQPGSSFKPFVYATGIEQEKLTAATILKDEKTDFGGYVPYNYDRKFRGDVTVRRALANSLNVPAVEAMDTVGVENAMDTAKNMGLTTLTETPETYGLPLALGSGQAKLNEMTNAYATFANGGVHNDMQSILKITDKYKKQIFESRVKDSVAISPATAFIISSILSDNSARAETFGSSLTVSGSRPVAVKTGTTEDYRDAWAIGYTPGLAIGVWIGNNDNTPMSSVAGSSGAAPIWRSLMQQYLNGVPIEQFAQPSNVVARDVCRVDGALAATKSDNTYTEYFRRGTLPNKTCNEKPKEEPKKTEEEPSNNEVKNDTSTSSGSGNGTTTSGGSSSPQNGAGTSTGTGTGSGGTTTGSGGTSGSGTGTGTGTGTGSGSGTNPGGSTLPTSPLP